MTESASDAALARAQERAPLWFLPAGALIGFLGTLAGIGGGLFAVPLLFHVTKIPLKHATGTALLLVLATTTASSLGELARHDSQIDWAVVLPLVIGVLLGTGLGFRISERLDERGLKLVFVVVLGIAGARVLFLPHGAGIGATGTDSLPLAALLAFLVGIGGGAVAPLLGVGGGLIMVPGLYLSIASLGFAGARACSLAAGALGAMRSLALHAKVGHVHARLGLPLALGALAGALLAVESVRTPWVAQGGRILLGSLLWVEAGHLALGLLRRSPSNPGAADRQA